MSRGERTKDAELGRVRSKNILLGVGFAVLGIVTGIGDVSAWIGADARVVARTVRHDTGCGWRVPVYEVRCNDRLEERYGAKHVFLDTPPAPGSIVRVHCSKDRGVRSDADYAAEVRRDVAFLMMGLAIVGWEVRRVRRYKRRQR